MSNKSTYILALQVKKCQLCGISIPSRRSKFCSLFCATKMQRIKHHDKDAAYNKKYCQEHKEERRLKEKTKQIQRLENKLRILKLYVKNYHKERLNSNPELPL